MADTFKPGEIAILAHPNHFTEYRGQDCTVMSDFSLMETIDDATLKVTVKPAYKIMMPNGERFCVQPHQLRKKKLPTPEMEVLRELHESQ